MKLYLVRHGIASQKIGGAVVNDGQRPLTDEGRIETRMVAAGLKKIIGKPSLIVTSPLVRAMQTAEILVDVFSVTNKLYVCHALAPGGNASDLYKFLRDFETAEDVCLVGHEPDMGRLAGTLLWAGELDIPFKKAGICRIDITSVPPTSAGTLKWFLPPKIISLLGR